MTSDFDFVENLYSNDLVLRANKDGIGRLSDPEKNVLLVWWAKGEIDNGGFCRLYSLPVDIDAVVNAFKAVGLPSAAKDTLESKDVFGDVFPQAVNERLMFIDREYDPANAKDPWHFFDRAIWSLGDALDHAVAAYVRENGLA